MIHSKRVLMEYLDVDLELSADKHSGEFSFRIKCEEVEIDQGFTSAFPLDSRKVYYHDDWLKVVANKQMKDPEVEEKFMDLGKGLFDALFTEKSKPYFQRIQDYADQGRLPICIWIYSQDSLLSSTPWELLYDARKGGFVFLGKDDEDPGCYIVRSIHSDKERTHRSLRLPAYLVKMVIAGASPINKSNPHERAEMEVIRASLSRAERVDKEAISDFPGLTWNDFKLLLHEERPHILHLIVHGTHNDLVFEDADKRDDPISYKEFGQRLSEVPLPKLVVLSVCHSDSFTAIDSFATLARTLSEDVKAVVAMRSEISSPAAIEFSKSFYAALGEGCDVACAVGVARRYLYSLPRPESMQWSVPMLYQNARVIPFPLIQASIPFAPLEVPRHKLLKIRDEINKTQPRLHRTQEAIVASTPISLAPLRHERYHLSPPLGPLQDLLSLETSYDCQWTEWINEVWYLSEQAIEMFETYEGLLEDLVDSDSSSNHSRLKKETNKVEKALQSCLSSIASHISRLLDQERS